MNLKLVVAIAVGALGFSDVAQGTLHPRPFVGGIERMTRSEANAQLGVDLFSIYSINRHCNRRTWASAHTPTVAGIASA